MIRLMRSPTHLHSRGSGSSGRLSAPPGPKARLRRLLLSSHPERPCPRPHPPLIRRRGRAADQGFAVQSPLTSTSPDAMAGSTQPRIFECPGEGRPALKAYCSGLPLTTPPECRYAVAGGVLSGCRLFTASRCDPTRRCWSDAAPRAPARNLTPILPVLVLIPDHTSIQCLGQRARLRLAIRSNEPAGRGNRMMAQVNPGCQPPVENKSPKRISPVGCYFYRNEKG